MRHWKLEPASVEEKAKVGVASPVGPLGPGTMVVGGAVGTTVKLRLAGVASTLPTASVARTSKVCAPSARAAGVCEPGPEQAPNAPESIRHWKLEPASVEEKANVGVASPVGPL